MSDRPENVYDPICVSVHVTTYDHRTLFGMPCIFRLCLLFLDCYVTYSAVYSANNKKFASVLLSIFSLLLLLTLLLSARPLYSFSSLACK